MCGIYYHHSLGSSYAISCSCEGDEVYENVECDDNWAATLTPPSGSYKTIACGGKRSGHFCCAVDKDDDSMECFGAGDSYDGSRV